MDFGAPRGTPVLAAMDGSVAWAGDTQEGCGKGVALRHDIASPRGNRFTLYCHLRSIDVLSGQSVRRGETIGRVGTTGNAVGVPHVHFELSADSRSHRDGDLGGTEDPLRYFAGCFDARQSYPAGEFALTYPVRCTAAPRLEC